MCAEGITLKCGRMCLQLAIIAASMMTWHGELCAELRPIAIITHFDI